MSLKKLINNQYTDKNTTHSYISLYEKLLYPIRDTAKNVLEIGIGNFKAKNGGSILLWSQYFSNAKIYGIDILPKHRVLDELYEKDNVELFTETNGYNKNFIDDKLKDKKFDFLLDDGPHTLKSQEDFVELYSPLLNENGILIVEDVQSIEWLKKLTDKTPEHLKTFIKTYDLRENKGRYDDIVFTIDRINR